MYAEVMNQAQNILAQRYHLVAKTPATTPTTAVKLYRAMGPGQLLNIQKSNWKSLPARLPNQAFFYPLTSLTLARNIARQWNLQRSGAGFVVEFSVNSRFLKTYPKDELAGGEGYEYLIPAHDMDELNTQLIGPIHVVDAFFQEIVSKTHAASTTHKQVSFA